MFDVTLRDGTAAVVLPLQREDKEQLVAGFEELSDEARRQRFLTPTAHLSEAMLEHLVDDVDFIDHVAYVLAAESEPGVFDPVAIGRMVRYEDEPTCADVAVTVKDAHQGRGIASALLQVLAEQRPAGVTRVVTEVMTGNQASLAMLKRLGPTTVESNGYGAFDVEVELYAAGAVDPEPGDETIVSAEETAGLSIPITRPRPQRRRPRMDRRAAQALKQRDVVCPWIA